jgi:hypothetical protein
VADHVEPPKRWKLANASHGVESKRRRYARDGVVYGVLIWHRDAGEGEVLLHPALNSAHSVVQLDALADWIELLTAEYDARCKDSSYGEKEDV